MEAVSKSFGGLTAINEVGFGLENGELVSLIGPNGAGKTTMLNVIMGVYPVDRGKIFFKGQQIESLPCYARSGLGISRTFQLLKLFNGLTALDNVKIGAHHLMTQGIISPFFQRTLVKREETEVAHRAMELVHFVGLENCANSKVQNLSYGQQKFVGLARALAGEPDLLLLDEVGSGLNTYETDVLKEKLRVIHKKGITILLVEHDMHLVMDISDRIIVLDQGSKISEGSPRMISADPKVIEVYLGKSYELAKG